MSMKKNVSRSIAIALVGVSMITPVLNSVSAMEPVNGYELINSDSYASQEDTSVDTSKAYAEDDRLGGGPSPSAAWTYSKSYKKTLTASQLDNLSAKYQITIKSDTFVADKYAYNISVTALGIWGGKTGTITSAMMGVFGKSFHSEIQGSANVIASAASKNKSVTLSVKEYIRPASGEKMIIFY